MAHRRTKSGVKRFFIGAAGFASVCVCAFFIFFLHTVTFLPTWISIAVRSLLVCLIAASLIMTVINIKDTR